MSILFLFVLISSGYGAEKLSSYNVDPSEISVSGLSSGAFFATQMHVAFSSSIKGAGIVAGGPYDCAGQMSYTSCMYTSTPSIIKSISNTKLWSGKQIDHIENLSKQKIYMISGLSDTTVGGNVMNQLYKYYVTDGKFIPSENVIFKKDLQSAHTFPTDFDSNGNNACGSTSTPYISNCRFDGAGAILQHIYGNLNPRNNGLLNGKLIQFSQAEFLSNPKSFGMDENGWIYVPQNCEQGQSCKLHLAYHGCLQGYQKIGDRFVQNTGYNRWADTNNLIIVYPQAVSTMTGSGTTLPNTNGCWDWIGWYGKDFDIKTGKQLSTMKLILDRITKNFNSIYSPTDLQIISTNDYSITLSWKQVLNANNYHIFRNSIQINQQRINQTQFTDTNLQSGTRYIYTVKAVSSTGSLSPFSNSIEGKTTGQSPPIERPSGLQITTITSNSITLKWNSLSNAKSYSIYRNGNEITNVILPTYIDISLKSGTEYIYQITARKDGIQSDKSNEVKGITSIDKICSKDNNYNHVLSGKAYQSLGYAYANGSNDKMGLYNIFYQTNLCQTGENYYIIE